MKSQLSRQISADEISRYEQDGIVWLRGIIDPQWAHEIQAAAARVAARPPASSVDFTNLGLAADAPQQISGARGGEDWTAADVDWGTAAQLAGNVLLDDAAELSPSERGHFLSVTNCWRVDPLFEELALRSPLGELAACVMRSQQLRLYSDQLLIKPPMTLEKTAWHHDISYDHIEGEQVCGLRVPTTQESFEMGAVRYWRGSHLDGTIYKVNFFISNKSADDDPGAAYPDLDGCPDDYDIVYFEPQPGDVVVHHLRTVHGAGGNLTADQTRCAITLRYTGDDVVYKHRPWGPPQPKITLRDGDPLSMDAERFPRAWPHTFSREKSI